PGTMGIASLNPSYESYEIARPNAVSDMLESRNGSPGFGIDRRWRRLCRERPGFPFAASAQALGAAEIGVLHLRVLRQISGRAGQHVFSHLQHGREIRDFERELDRLLGEQNGQPFPMQP